jgi:hypothetical protein
MEFLQFSIKDMPVMAISQLSPKFIFRIFVSKLMNILTSEKEVDDESPLYFF